VAAALWRLFKVAVPEIPDAAYRASIPPPPGTTPGSTIGVSGGGGDPRLARVVEVDAVEANLFTLLAPGIFNRPSSGGCGRALLLELWLELLLGLVELPRGGG